MNAFMGALEKERGNQVIEDFAKDIGISRASYYSVKSGRQKQTVTMVNKVADFFGWSEKLRMKCMPEINPRYAKEMIPVVQHMRLLGLNTNQAAKVLGVSKTTIKQWYMHGYPKKRQALIQTFLKTSERTAHRLLASDGDENLEAHVMREPLDIELINKVLMRYKDLEPNEFPLDDPDVIKMRESVGAL